MVRGSAVTSTKTTPVRRHLSRRPEPTPGNLRLALRDREPPTFGIRFDDAEGAYQFSMPGRASCVFRRDDRRLPLDAVLEAALGDIEVDEDDREAGEVPSGHLPSTWPHGRRVSTRPQFSPTRRSATFDQWPSSTPAAISGASCSPFAYRGLTARRSGSDPRTLTQRISRIVSTVPGRTITSSSPVSTFCQYARRYRSGQSSSRRARVRPSKQSINGPSTKRIALREALQSLASGQGRRCLTVCRSLDLSRRRSGHARASVSQAAARTRSASASRASAARGPGAAVARLERASLPGPRGRRHTPVPPPSPDRRRSPLPAESTSARGP